MNKRTPHEKLLSLFWLAFRFGIVGLGSIAVYFLFLFLLRPFIVNTITLTGVAYVASAVFNFVLQNFFTFQADEIGTGKIVKYVLMHLLCMTINSGLMFILVDISGQHLYVSQLIVTSIVAGVSFALSYFFVYAR